MSDTSGIDSAVYGEHPSLPPAPGQVGADPARPYGQPASQQPEQREPYLGSRRDRHFSEWNQPDEALLNARNNPQLGPITDASMPQTRDFPGIIHALAGAALLWPRGSGMNMIRSATFATAFWQSYQQGHNQAAARNYQQYRQQRQQALDDLSDAQREYHDAYMLYGPNPQGKTQKEVTGDPYKLHQSLWDISTRHNDPAMQAGLREGNESALMNLLRGRDHSIIEMEKMTEQEERQRLQDIELRNRIKLQERRLAAPPGDPGWDYDPETGAGTTGLGAGTPAPAAAPSPAPSTEKPDEPAEPDTEPPAEPTTTGAAPAIPQGGPGAVPQAGAPAANWSTYRPPTDPRVRAYTDDAVRGVKPEIAPPKDKSTLISAEAARQKAALDDLMAHGMTGDEKADLARIRRINPELADDVETMGQYRRLLPSGGQNMYANMENIVRKVYPNWDPSIYKYIEDYRRANGLEQRNFERIGSFKGATIDLFRALQNVPESMKPFQMSFQEFTSRNFTGTGEIIALKSALYNAVFEALTVANGGRQPQANQVKQEFDKFNANSPERIRALLANEATMASSRAEEANKLWKQNTHRNEDAPGYIKDTVDWLKAVGNMNFKTGGVRPGTIVPKELRDSNFLGPAGYNLRAGTPGGPSVPVYTTQQIDDARKWLNDPANANDPRRPKVEKFIKDNEF